MYPSLSCMERLAAYWIRTLREEGQPSAEALWAGVWPNCRRGEGIGSIGYIQITCTINAIQ